MLIDTHSHLNFDDYKEDYDEVIKRALAQEIGMINVGCDFKTSQKAISLALIYPERASGLGLYAAIGLHPLHIQDEEFNFEEYEKLARHEKVVAIGEIGLDYYHVKDKKTRELQREIFLRQLELARKVNKPLIIHCREAHRDLIKILKTTLTDERGVIHCFSGTWAEAEEYLDMGLLLGFNGIITFSDNYNEIIKKLPLEKILIETDCPFLTPAPFRGKRNEPAYVKYVAEKIAQIKDLTFKEVAEKTTENAGKLFRIKI